MEREYEAYMEAEYQKHLEAEQHRHFMETDSLYAARHVRDTHAETLRVLLLREAGRRSGFARVHLRCSEHDGRMDEDRTRSGEERAMAGIALILALMIGGE
jgi:hypothetical protein